jgi:hypothetical protein
MHLCDMTFMQINNKIFFLADMEDMAIGNADSYPVTVATSKATIFSETLYADEDGYVYLRDLAGLLRPYMPTSGVETITITVGERTATIRVVRCDKHVGDWGSMDAVSWLNTHYLNTTSVKYLRPTGYEALHLIPTEALTSCPVSIEARYRDNDGNYLRQSFTLKTIDAEAYVIATVNVSVPTVLEELQTVDANAAALTGYFVSIGSRKMRYIVDRRRSTSVNTFRFANAFGAQERLSIIGTRTAERSFSRTEIKVNGKRKVVGPAVTIKHIVEATLTEDWEVESLTEMLASETAAVSTSRGYEEVTFSDDELAPTTAADGITDVKFAFTIAADNHRYNSSEAGSDRIFDESFDETFE